MKTVLVTGASGGIGSAAALELARRHPEYLRLAGSDTHQSGDECRAGVLLPERVRDSFAYRRMIETGRFQLWGPEFSEFVRADEDMRKEVRK